MNDIIFEDKRTDEQLLACPDPFKTRIYTLEDAMSKLKFGIDRRFGWDATAPGKRCWKLARVELVWGPSVYMVRVANQDGTPRENILVINWWPGVQKHNRNDYQKDIHPYYAETDYYDAGWTNGNGDHGVAFGPGSVITTSGPDMIWVSASPPGIEPQTSDCVKNMGWLGGTNYVHLNLEFRDTLKLDSGGGGNGGNGGGGGGGGTLTGEVFVAIVGDGEVIQKVAVDVDKIEKLEVFLIQKLGDWDI